jgi:hypothetical protein
LLKDRLVWRSGSSFFVLFISLDNVFLALVFDSVRGVSSGRFTQLYISLFLLCELLKSFLGIIMIFLILKTFFKYL